MSSVLMVALCALGTDMESHLVLELLYLSKVLTYLRPLNTSLLRKVIRRMLR